MKFVVLVVVTFFICVQTAAGQDKPAQSDGRYIVIYNKKYEPIKEINIGDKVMLILTTSKKFKGHITSIDSTFFTVDSSFVPLNEVERISTKKEWVKLLGLPLVAFGGFFTIAGLAYIGDIADDNLVGAALLLGIPITAAGVGVMRPGYHKIGKSKKIMIIR